MNWQNNLIDTLGTVLIFMIIFGAPIVVVRNKK